MKKPIFLLVHGGMVGGWCWKKVCHGLEDQGYKVLAPTLTGLGDREHLGNPNVDLEVHLTAVAKVMFYEECDDVILVGHSYGGMVITGVADRIPHKIKRLIYLDALIPKDG